MNHLCNKHCEGCGSDLAQEVVDQYEIDPATAEYRFVAAYGVNVRPQTKARNKKRGYLMTPPLPVVLEDVGEQKYISSSFCPECSMELTRVAPSYNWCRCARCGIDVTTDNSTVAFRTIEVEPDFLSGDMIEEHYLSTTRRMTEVINADATEDQASPEGAIGWTYCVDCMAEIAEDASSPEDCTNKSSLKHVFRRAMMEGDW